jgi:hypothetical protein
MQLPESNKNRRKFYYSLLSLLQNEPIYSDRLKISWAASSVSNRPRRSAAMPPGDFTLRPCPEYFLLDLATIIIQLSELM